MVDISKEELISLENKVILQSKIFETYDKKKTDFLTGKALYFALCELFKKLKKPIPNSQQVYLIAKQYDKDQNHKIDRREFHKICKDFTGLSKRGKKYYQV